MDTQELQRENEQLKLALRSALGQLAEYQAIRDYGFGALSGTIIQPDGKFALMRSANRIFGVHFPSSTPEIQSGEQYVILFNLDAHWQETCHTHHVFLQADKVIPVKLNESLLVPKDETYLWLFSQALTMFSDTK